MPDDRWLLDRARDLRREMAPAEKILWQKLRNRWFAGFKFRRQAAIDGYIVDFDCAECKLVIELDGESHVGNEDADRNRQNDLEKHGLKVLRIWNPDLFDNLGGVLQAIYEECGQRSKGA
jgi:very-short-patch-repair endonuclease